MGSDGYLYMALLKPNAQDMNWVKSEQAAATEITNSSKMKVRQNVVYLANETTFYITDDFGSSWTSVDLPSPEERFYSAAMHVASESYILLASAVEVIQSTDGGKDWAFVPKTKQVGSINSNAKFVVIGGVDELWASAINQNGVSTNKWHYIDLKPTYNSSRLLGQIANIIFDDRYSVIYLIQENGISYGKIAMQGDEVNITFSPPFTNIKDYIALGENSDYFILGDVFLQLMEEPIEERRGNFNTYKMNGNGLPGQKDFIQEVDSYSDPYAGYVHNVGPKVKLRVLSNAKDGSYKLYLSNRGNLSLSSNGGKDWQPININV